MLGKNPIRPPMQGDGLALDVQDIFLTVQGEGPRAGEAAVFVRLGGCNLACDFCDTEFESFTTRPLDVVITRVEELSKQAPEKPAALVVITGGEPLRQPIERLCETLVAKGFTVQIETNGTIYRTLPPQVEWVCSPKNSGKGYKPIRLDVLSRTNAIKFIVSSHHTLYREVAEVGQSGNRIPVYIQPMDEHDSQKNAENVAYARTLAQTKGYHLSLQMHKIMGMP
ncbi:MAG: 7-carboxy-7-deazaguanine synthase QueE [Proteobacteria bacterium]|nr:7-carboxy-7-deazaguanine synthase QueE [Pseudomonadota bacterium]